MTPVPQRILVVDDDPTARILFQASLTRFGFHVGLAASGEEALQLFRAQPFDMVLLDIGLGGISGFEVCTLLRAEADPLLPILMVTGMDDVQSVERAYASGATDFIAKPMCWALIGHRVKHLLRGHQTLLDLRDAHASHAAVLRAIPDLLFEMDAHGRYLALHTARTNLLTVPVKKLIGQTVNDVLPAQAAQVCMAALQTAHATGSSFGQQFELTLAKGVCWFELSVSRKDTRIGEPARFIVLSRDITERKVSEQKTRRLAFFDSLTALPNQSSFLARVEREIQRAQQNNVRLAVLFMGLDGFKKINDTLGYNAGDQVLQHTADRLRDMMRAADVLARLGSDEFAVLVSDIQQPDDVQAIAQRILELMRQPFALNGQTVQLSVSLGVTLYPADGQDAATLLKQADSAHYQAKDAGRDNCQFYGTAT